MSISKRLVATAVSAAVLFAPAAASAECILADLEGRWQLYSSGWTDREGGRAYWSRCLLRISATGVVSHASCVDSVGGSGPLTGGQFTLMDTKLCSFSAQFRAAGTLNDINHATLAQVHTELMSGVGTFPGGTFTFTMIKNNAMRR